MKHGQKPLPTLRSDEETEQLVAAADRSRYHLSGFKPMRFELEPRAAALRMRLPATLLDAVKARADARGMPYTRYVSLLLEADVARGNWFREKQTLHPPQPSGLIRWTGW